MINYETMKPDYRAESIDKLISNSVQYFPNGLSVQIREVMHGQGIQVHRFIQCIHKMADYTT